MRACHEFDTLAAKVLANEASPLERVRLEELLEQSFEKRKEFDDLASIWKQLQVGLPVVHAMDAPTVPIPEDRLLQLLAPAKPKLPPRQGRSGDRRLWLLAASVTVLASLAGVLFFTHRPSPNRISVGPPNSTCGYLLTLQGQPEVRRAGGKLPADGVTRLRMEDEIRLPAGTRVTLITSNGAAILTGPRLLTLRDMEESAIAPPPHALSASLRTALFSPARKLLAVGLLASPTRGGETIPIYSPVGATANLAPRILWKTEPGKTYDLLLTDEFNSNTPPWRLSGVGSPVEFSQVAAWQGRILSKEGLYRLRLNETGKPLTACEQTFRTLSGADTSPSASPIERLSNAFTLLTSDPPRVGDALANLVTLPLDLGNSDLALRLKLVAFGQLAYQADFEDVMATLHRGP